MSSRRTLLKFLCLPIILMLGTLSFPIYMIWKECKINNILVEESLGGNQYAVAILSKYKEPWKLNERIVRGAIQGNPYALEVLMLAQETKSK